MCFLINPIVRTLEVRLNQIKKKKVKGPCLYCPCQSSFSAHLSHFIVLHLHVIFFFSSSFFLLLFFTIVLSVRCETVTDTSYIWFRDLLNTSQALHTVNGSGTDCAQSKPLFTTRRPQSERASTLHKLLVCAVGTVCREEVQYWGCALCTKSELNSDTEAEHGAPTLPVLWMAAIDVIFLFKLPVPGSA